MTGVVPKRHAWGTSREPKAPRDFPKYRQKAGAEIYSARVSALRWIRSKPAKPLDLTDKQRKSVCMNSPTPFPAPYDAAQVAFHRTELSVILSLYGRMVAAGEWRDYGISSLRDLAVFSVFRRTAENPLYRIEKRPKLRNKQGQYSVVSIDGQVLKRGNDLKTVLRVLERKLIRSVE